MPRETQTKRDGLVNYCGKEGHLKQDCSQASKPPSASDHTARETAPRGIGFTGQTLKTIRTEDT